MAALTRSALAAALAFTGFATTPAAASPLDRWRPLIAEASQRFGIPQEWIVAVMRAESGGMTTLDGRPITSAAGAMGLMQVMPDTWAAMRDALHLGVDPYDPRDNILAGTFYLRRMRDRFGYPGMFAAYNAGPARYAAHLVRGRALPGETIAYLANVSAGTKATPAPGATRPRQAIFFAVSSASSAVPAKADSPRGDGLFVPWPALPAGPIERAGGRTCGCGACLGWAKHDGRRDAYQGPRVPPNLLDANRFPPRPLRGAPAAPARP